MRIWSPAWQTGEAIPELYTRSEANFSPALNWQDLPAGTVSLALICSDPDASRHWYHWLIWNIPAHWNGLPQHLPRQRTYLDLCQGMTSYHSLGYDGPAPPPGETHRYVFRLYALDRMLKLASGIPGPQLERALQGKVLAQAELKGLYSGPRSES